MRRAVLVLVLAACSSTRLPLTPTHLPATRVGDFFLVECTIDGRGPYNLVLDTGSAWLVLDPAVGRARVVRAGPLATKGLRTQIRPMGPLSRALGVRTDGILPYAFFRDVLLTIDYPGGAVLVSSERLAAGVPTDAFEERPFVEVELQGRAHRMLVDTGSGVECALPTARGIDWAVPPREFGRSQTIHGVRVRRGGRARGYARVGGLTVERPTIEIGVDTPRIGAGLLRRARITFDQRSRLVRVEGS